MPHDLDVSGLYRRAINLWVEDALTADYLSTVWGAPPEVLFLIGGGNQGVVAILKDAQDSGFKNVFGLVDSDFRTSNRPDWKDPDKNFLSFVLSAHEIENHLLHAKALAGCDFNNLGRTADDIQHELERRAGGLNWWMACRDVLAQLSHLFRDDFPDHPKCPDVTNEDQAVTHILDSRWHSTLADRMAQAEEAVIRRQLVEAKARADAQLRNAEWQTQFCGKEIFHHIRSWIYNSSKRRVSKSELDADVAKAVARWQFENSAVPDEITELLAALRQRVGIG